MILTSLIFVCFRFGWVASSRNKGKHSKIRQFFSCLFHAITKVSKSKSKVSEAGKATSKGFSAFCAAIMQWDDAKHPGIQRVKRLSALPASELNKPLSSSKKANNNAEPRNFKVKNYSLSLSGSFSNGLIGLPSYDSTFFHVTWLEHEFCWRPTRLDE